MPHVQHLPLLASGALLTICALIVLWLPSGEHVHSAAHRAEVPIISRGALRAPAPQHFHSLYTGAHGHQAFPALLQTSSLGHSATTPHSTFAAPEIKEQANFSKAMTLLVSMASLGISGVLYIMGKAKRKDEVMAMASTAGSLSGEAYGDLEAQVQRALLRADLLEVDETAFGKTLQKSLHDIFSRTNFSSLKFTPEFRMWMTQLTSRFTAVRRRTATTVLFSFFQNIFGSPPAEARSRSPFTPGDGGPTNEVVKVVNGIRQKRLGGGDIIVSEMGLGTQRWGSTDFNAPDEALCHKFLDRAVLGSGVNLVDTAEQYPIPSDFRRPEGLTEEIIGRWHKQDKSRRERLVIATKITGGRNVNRSNIIKDCEGSLKRLQTDYIDVYLLHWPARYTPQANWGQSLAYYREIEQSRYYQGATSFEDICLSMGDLIKQGKIRGWGMCNDNAFGLTACSEVAKQLGLPGPVSMQNDFSLNDRRAEENGVTEASSPIHENVGFMAYNALAGGILTGKYFDGPGPATPEGFKSRRGRFDEPGWGYTLYRYYSAPAMRSARVYSDLAKKYNMSLTELSLRWCREREGVTSVLVGQTSMNQLEEDLRYFQNSKPLPAELMAAIDIQHMRNRLPIFCSEEDFSEWDGTGRIGEPIP